MKRKISILLVTVFIATALWTNGLSVFAANTGDTFNDFRASLESGLWKKTDYSQLKQVNGVIVPNGKSELEKIYFYDKKFTNFDFEFEIKIDVKTNSPAWTGAIAIRDKIKDSMYANDTVAMNIYLNLDTKNPAVMLRGATVAAPRKANKDDEVAIGTTYENADYADGKWHKIKVKLTNTSADKITFYYAVDGKVLVNNQQYINVTKVAGKDDVGYLSFFVAAGFDLSLRPVGGGTTVKVSSTEPTAIVSSSSAPESSSEVASSSEPQSSSELPASSESPTSSENMTSSDSSILSSSAEPPEDEKSNMGLVIGIIIAIVLIGGAAVYYFILRKRV